MVVAGDGGRCAKGASGREAHRSPKSERDLRAKVAVRPNSVWQFDRPWPSSRRRWCARNDGLCRKNGLWKKDKENRQKADVSHRVASAASLPKVGQRVAAPAQRPDETIQDFHDPEKPDFRRRGNSPKALHSNFFANR